jgi:hypothetical protein
MTSTDGENSPEPTLAVKARTILDHTMRALVEGEPTVTAKAAAAKPPDDVKALLDDLLSKTDTYRDGALTLLAFPVAAGEPLDVTRRIDGDRAASGYLEALLRDLKIPARKDALQTIAKGSSTFIGRARKSWNELLEWASEEEALDDIEAAFLYMARAIAATARALPSLPAIDVSRLMFQRVVDLLDELLATPSGGAYEQFIFGALLYAAAEQECGRRRIETKSLTAADASAGTAADVQVWDGGVVAEAYEVTANVWHSKANQALDTLRRHDLRRVHIVAPAPNVTAAEIAAHVPEEADVSVLDVRHELRSLVHRLQRTGRRVALEKLYEHLVERQPRDDLVVQYVTAISAHKLAE